MNGKVYKIEDKESGEIYIGSTIMFMSKRIASHRSDCKRYDEGKRKTKCSSFNIIRRNNFTVEVLHKLVCEDKKELHKLERETIEKYGDKCVNKMRRPMVTYEEKLKLNLTCNLTDERKKKKAETGRKYREANKEAIKEHKKAYHEANKEAIAERRKAYREANKEAIKERKKAYYEANKEAINQRRKDKKAK